MHALENVSVNYFILMLVVEEVVGGSARVWLFMVEGMGQEKHVLCILLGSLVIRWSIFGQL